MTFVVAGATGNTGKVVAEALLARGKSVRLVVRDAKKVEALTKQGAEVAVADLGDTDALARALAGAEGAYLLVPPNMGAPDFRAYQRATIASITAALTKSPVKHVVLLSSIGAQHPDKTGPIAALHGAEASLRGIPGVTASFLRAGYFIENLAGSLGMLDQGILPSFVPADQGIDMIATQDIGKVATDLLLEPPKAHQVIELGGPSRTMNDAAAAIAKLTGKQVSVQVFPVAAMADTLTSMGLPRGMAELYQEMTEGMLSGRVAFEGGHRRVEGSTSIEEVLRPILTK